MERNCSTHKVASPDCMLPIIYHILLLSLVNRVPFAWKYMSLARSHSSKCCLLPLNFGGSGNLMYCWGCWAMLAAGCCGGGGGGGGCGGWKGGWGG